MEKKPTPGGDLKIVTWASIILSALKFFGVFTYGWPFALSPLWLYLGLMLLRLLLFTVYVLIRKRDEFKWQMAVWFIMQRDCISRGEAGIKYHYIQKRKQVKKKKYPQP